VTLHVQSFSPFNCPWDFVINPPGYCSDPCDYGMTSTIYGPEDICLKNCPDNPLDLTLEVNGGTPPYTMDFTLNATGYAPWVFNQVAVNDVTDIRVCMDSVPAPIFNSTTYTLTLPNFLGDSYVTFSIGNVFDKFGCTSILDPAEHSLYVHKLPQIKSTNLAFCWEEAKNVNLTDYDLLINPFLDVTWWDGNPFDGGQQIFNATGTNLHNVNQLWAHVADDYCENSIRVPLTIYRTPRLDSIPPIQLCEGTPIKPNAIPIHDAANSGATYTFHNAFPPDSTNLIDSAYYLPLTTDTIYVVATNWMCHDTLPIILVVQPYPTFTLDGVPCNLLQNTFSVLFTSSADSIATTAGIVHNHPVGQDSIVGIPENTNITIYLFNPSRMCKDTFSIVAPNCNCPTINQPVTAQSGYQLCENDALPLLSVTVDPGLVANWYDVPSGGVPLLQNSLTFQPVNPANATYYAEALDQNSGCYSLRTPIDININPLANLQALPDPVLCETQTINFNTTVPSVLNGVPGSGQWYNLVTHAPVSGSIAPQNGDAWYYLFTTTNGACTTSDTIAATVNPAPSFDSYNVDCIDATLLYNFYFTSDATTVGANVGTLTQIPGTDSFQLSGIPYDTDILFNLQNAVTGCSIAFTQQAPNCSCPSLLDVTSTQYCSSSGVLD
ncbi:MAG TPA: hypothetical protein VJ508_06420, partial [Saprospiraceae bacterium]|nr:hypothetical protein [Saprospiraceae bacterium]